MATLILLNKTELPKGTPSEALVAVWDKGSVPDGQISIPVELNERLLPIRDDLAAWTYETGCARIDGKLLEEHLRADDNLSMWWCSTLVEKHPHGQPPHYNWHATYRYSIDGRQRQYHAYFKEPATPPLKLYLYYLNNPNKLFSYEEYHYENHKGIVMLALTALPWALAVAAMFLLKIERPGA